MSFPEEYSITWVAREATIPELEALDKVTNVLIQLVNDVRRGESEYKNLGDYSLAILRSLEDPEPLPDGAES